ncbi:MAG TPA: hypothetical protein VFA32_06205 [Dehalococcoidia bacterium]|jgi:hypothetical protein|nr:hypothetical protein [Dehalococcoidia bacterium]
MSTTPYWILSAVDVGLRLAITLAQDSLASRGVGATLPSAPTASHTRRTPRRDTKVRMAPRCVLCSRPARWQCRLSPQTRFLCVNHHDGEHGRRRESSRFCILLVN